MKTVTDYDWTNLTSLLGVAPQGEEILDTCLRLAETLMRKNAAYGDSALNPVRVFSRADVVEQIKVRIDDKLSRLSRGHSLPDESLDDTVTDLMGYLVLLKIATARSNRP